MNIKNLLGMLSISRDNFKKRVDKAHKKKQDSLKELKETMLPNTQAYKEKEREIYNDYELEVALAMKEETEMLAPTFQELKEYEMSRTQRIDETVLSKINALSNIPLSQIEIIMLADKFNANSNYWANRAIANLAEKNAIDITSLDIEPSIDRKIEILNNLEKQTEQLFTEYNPGKPLEAKISVLLSESVLKKAESMYTNGIVEVSNEQKTERAMLNIKSTHGTLERAMIINNTLSNTKGEVRNLLLCKLAGENFDDITLQLCNYKDEIESFKNGRAKEYKRAMETIETIRNIKDDILIKQKINECKDNEFIDNLVKLECKDNLFIAKAFQEERTIRDSVEIMGEKIIDTE